MSIENEIEYFFDHFENLRKSVIDAKFNYVEEINKAVLLCSIIDAISNVVYSGLSNNEKFVFFVDDFSGWDNTNRISIVQLFYFLKKKTDKKYEPLKSYIKKKITSMIGGKIYTTKFDEYLYNLKYLKVIENEITIFTYSRLLYRYRNCVIHELRTPGWGSNFTNISHPFYYSLAHISDKPTFRTWELVFPIIYISDLVKNMLQNLKKYCLDNKINPYESFAIDTLWLSKTDVKKRIRV